MWAIYCDVTWSRLGNEKYSIGPLKNTILNYVPDKHLSSYIPRIAFYWGGERVHTIVIHLGGKSDHLNLLRPYIFVLITLKVLIIILVAEYVLTDKWGVSSIIMSRSIGWISQKYIHRSRCVYMHAFIKVNVWTYSSTGVLCSFLLKIIYKLNCQSRGRLILAPSTYWTQIRNQRG
jgi:hypothetical protein